MTREEAQALAESLILDLARGGRSLAFQEAGTAFAKGICAFGHAMATDNDGIHTSAVAMLAATAVELLRESYLQCGQTADAIRADHLAYLRGGAAAN